MNWNIVKVEISGEDVLGVVIGSHDDEFYNLYCIIARSKLAVTDENIEVLQHTPVEEILSWSKSGRDESDLHVVGEHSLRDHFIKQTKKYEEKYSKMNCVQLIEEINNGTEHIDTLHRHILVDIAEDKGIGGIAHQLLQN